MRERARPKVGGRLFGEPGANRVQIDVSQGDAEMVAVQGGREEAILPQVTASFPLVIQVDRVFIMCAAQSAGQRTLVLGDGDQVDVVRHQAPAEHPQAVPLGVMAQEREAGATIPVAEEDLLAVVAPLGDVVRDARRDHARDAWHCQDCGRSRGRRSRVWVTVP